MSRYNYEIRRVASYIKAIQHSYLLCIWLYKSLKREVARDHNKK